MNIASQRSCLHIAHGLRVLVQDQGLRCKSGPSCDAVLRILGLLHETRICLGIQPESRCVEITALYVWVTVMLICQKAARLVSSFCFNFSGHHGERLLIQWLWGSFHILRHKAHPPPPPCSQPSRDGGRIGVVQLTLQVSRMRSISRETAKSANTSEHAKDKPSISVD